MPGRYKAHPLGQAALALTLSLLGAASHGDALQIVGANRPSIIDISHAKIVSALDPSRLVAVTITLPFSNEADLDSFADDVSNPASSRYGQYLTPTEFAAKYGASQADYDAVLAWAKSSGLSITQTSLSRNSVSLSGTAAQMGHAFGVKLNNYVEPSTGKAFFAAATLPKMPVALAGVVHGIYGLSSYASGHPMNVYLSPARRAAVLAAKAAAGNPDALTNSGSGGSGHGGAFSPQDLNAAYQMPPFSNSGKGQTLGFYTVGGIYASDATVYEKYYGLPPVPVVSRSVAGTNVTVPVEGNATEAALDAEMEIAMAPNATKIVAYEAGTEVDLSGSLVDALTAVADDDKISVLDISYGQDEVYVLSEDGQAGLKDENDALKRCAAEGISVFASSGDNGAYGDLGQHFYPASYNVSDPASQPYATGVGGTTMYFGGGIDRLEDSWNELPLDGASGGGVSVEWPIPSYQLFSDGTPITVYYGGSSKYRNVPDVSAVANPLTGVDIFTHDPAFTGSAAWLEIGGTSASAPIWAGFTAVLNQQRGYVGLPDVGFANPLLYGIYNADGSGNANDYSFADFDEVAIGTNGNENYYGSPGFGAGFGYDNVTGLGSLSGGVLMTDSIAALPGIAGETGNLPDAPYHFHVSSMTPTSVTFVWHSGKGATGYIITDAVVDPYYGAINQIIAKSTKLTTNTVGKLTPNTTYYFELAAVNKAGGTYDTDDFLAVTTPAQ